MPNYTVELQTTGRKVYKITEAKTAEQARSIARLRYDQEAPIGLVEESCIVTDIIVHEDKKSGTC